MISKMLSEMKKNKTRRLRRPSLTVGMGNEWNRGVVPSVGQQVRSVREKWNGTITLILNGKKNFNFIGLF